MKNPWEQPISNEKNKLTKSILAALPLITALNGMPGIAAERAYAEESNNNSKIEVIKSNEKQAIAFLGKLFNLPKQKNAPTPSIDVEMRKQVAKILIQSYALERKGMSRGNVSPEDISAAVNELWKSVGSYADQICGDRNGEVSTEDMEKLEEKLGPSNPGLEVLDEMHENYRNYEKFLEKK